MANLASLAGMMADDGQELKEAVCDAVLERTRHVVSGTGEHGAVILGDKPSHVLSSGFLIPRMVGGDDESNDIRIASHGMDVRLRGGKGVVTVKTNLSIYLRGLPTSGELFARDGRLIPKADFSPKARDERKREIKARAAAEIPARTPRDKADAMREAIVRQVTEAMGVTIPEGAQLAGGDDRDADGELDPALPPPEARGARLRIPDQISSQYKIPAKWVKIPVEVPDLLLRMPCDPAAWAQQAIDHKDQLLKSVVAACQAWARSSQGRKNAWRRVRPPSEVFWEPERWDQFLVHVRDLPIDEGALFPPVSASLLVQALPEALNSDCFSVRFSLDNLEEQDEDRECGLFDVSVEVGIPADSLVELRLERVKRSYHLNGFMEMPAIGVNGGVDDLGVRAGIHWLRSTWMPRYVLPRMASRSIPGLPVRYAELANRDTDVVSLSKLSDELASWTKQLERGHVTDGLEGSSKADVVQAARFADDLVKWREEADRVRLGADLLVRSQAAWQSDPASEAAIPYNSWLLTNESFSQANPASAENSSPGWRLFQIAFVLAHVPTLASRLASYATDFDARFDEESASLLYMSTGGGKTEAFFGIILFALFLDRLRGKKRGVTAMMHYPLRLLTVQQAQRLARLLAKAEMVRRDGRLGGAPFEIGFWVGSNNTPNRTEEGRDKLVKQLTCIPIWNSTRARDEAALQRAASADDRAYVAASESWNKLPECPFCGGVTGLRLFPDRRNALGIVCQEEHCYWNLEHDRGGRGQRSEPLPFCIVDSDIYRRAPSILLGTVDKLALLGQHTSTINKIAGMFGMARTIEGGNNGMLEMQPPGDPLPADAHYVKPSWHSGTEVFHDPFPSIIVQDELHLLEESLGTFGGIFETGLLTWLRYLAPILGARAVRRPGDPDVPRLPHFIGATATAADAEKHVRAIYQRRVVQFPHPGPSLHGGFYVELARFKDGGEAARARLLPDTPRGREAAAPWGRLYVSLMTNGRRHTVTTLAVLAAHAATITRWLRDLASLDPMRQARAAGEMERSVSASPWADRRRLAIREAAAAGNYAALANLVDLHRMMLTYVTNKKGGDQILSALDGEAHEAHAEMGPDYGLDQFVTTLVSGGVDIKMIQSVIRKARRSFDPMMQDVADYLRAIIATSAISHGVDVDAFNAMCFAGMPSDIAEFIQASSRVGRTHVGFSLLVPTPQTRRDRFIVEVHESFHRLLERMISPPAVERWADRAIERVVPSLLQTWLAGVRYQQRFAAAPDASKGTAYMPDFVERVQRMLGEPGAMDSCVAFVREAVGVNQQSALGGPTSPQHYRDLVLREVERIGNTISGGQFAGRLSEFWSNSFTNLKKPMTSLRDVDEAGHIIGSWRGTNNKAVTLEAVSDAMAFVRNRGAGRARRGASSETDSDSE